jgi:nitric oxide reductase subunit C
MKTSTLRTIFIAGTFLFSAIFVALSIDTMNYMRVSTNASTLTNAVVAGKIAWQKHDCTDCHTLLGNGAYYAPDLTRVHQVRGATFLSAWLTMPAGQMPNQKLAAQEVQDLLAFFEWVGKINTNGWPPAPLAVQAAAPVPAGSQVAEGQALFQSKGCAGCHGADAMGTAAAPTLMDVSQKFDDEYLEQWLKEPAAVKPGTTMPALGLTDPEIDTLLAYLHTLD